MFGIQHCSYWDCLMNGSGHLQEDFSQSFHLCPVDLHKVMTLTGSNVKTTYHKLLDFYMKYKCPEEQKWLEDRLNFFESSEVKNIDNQYKTKNFKIAKLDIIVINDELEEYDNKVKKNLKQKDIFNLDKKYTIIINDNIKNVESSKKKSYSQTTEQKARTKRKRESDKERKTNKKRRNNLDKE